MSATNNTASFQIGIKAVIMRDSRLLMLHMSDRDRWELPGGRINEGEDNYEQTLLRELHEELPDATNVTIGDIVHAHQTDFTVAGDRHLMLLFVQVTATVHEHPKLSNEHTAARWVTASELPTLPMNPTHRKAVRQIFQNKHA